MMGEQFVAGQTISAALANSRRLEERGFRYSYDMLGEAATTADDSKRYYESYEQAIHSIRSEEHTSELQSLMRISYAVFCLKKKKNNNKTKTQQKYKNTI